MTGKQVEVFSKLKYLLKINKMLISRYRNRKFAIYFCHAVANLEGLICTDYNDTTSPQALLYAAFVVRIGFQPQQSPQHNTIVCIWFDEKR